MDDYPFIEERTLCPEDDSFLLLVSRPAPLPAASKNCIIKAYCSREYDEHVYFKVISSDGQRLLSERSITIDEAYDMLSVDASRQPPNDDLQSMRALLVNMFGEADTAKKGYLTYDEFQLLMEKVDLGE